MNKILRLFFVSNAVSTPLLFIKESTRDISVITNRIAGGGTSLWWALLRQLFSLFIIKDDIGLKWGLLYTTTITQTFHIFIYKSNLMLQLTSCSVSHIPNNRALGTVITLRFFSNKIWRGKRKMGPPLPASLPAKPKTPKIGDFWGSMGAITFGTGLLCNPVPKNPKNRRFLGFNGRSPPLPAKPKTPKIGDF